MDNQKLIVKRKYRQKAEGSGLVKIISTIDLNGQTHEVSQTEFPSKLIWISKGYDEIEENFQIDEPFILEFYGSIDESNDKQDAVSIEDRAEHWSLGRHAKKVDTGSFVAVVNCPLPDKGTGILSDNYDLPPGQFFISNNGFVYGPFSATPTEDSSIVSPAQCLPLSLKQYHVAKIEETSLITKGLFLQIEDINEGYITGYVTSYKDISSRLRDQIEQVDFITDAQLITYFHKGGFASNHAKIGRKQAEQLKNAINEAVTKKNKLAEGERLTRLEKVLDTYLEEPEFGWPIVNNWLSSNDGKEFLKRLILENPKIASIHTKDLAYEKDNIKEEIASLKAEKRRAELEIPAIRKQVEQEKITAEEKINDIRHQTKQQIQEERQKLMADLELKIKESENKLDLTESEIEKVQSRLSRTRNAENLEKEIEFLERYRDELKQGVQAHEKTLRNPELTGELVKQHAILNLLQGRDFNQQKVDVKYHPAKMSSNDLSDGNSIIQTIANQFDENGRAFTFEEMANLLVTVQQSFMTVLKGMPGAGKTSTAIRLAQAHKICCETGTSDNFLNIPVSRGWVSGRDFVGFYNSLKGSYQPAKTGVYQFLRQGSENGANDSLRLILLDEANLSPIEHYMSDFLGLFDPEGRNRPIDCGIPDSDMRYLSVPDNVRFIATINNDATTELLSPRLCDRVPIISMDIEYSQSINSSTSFNLDGAIPIETLDEFFGLSSENHDDLPTKVQMIIDLFEERDRELGQIIAVSKRKRIAIQNYFTTASKYIDETSATDFATSQYLLPLINGFGDKYRKRLDKIGVQIQRSNLNRSERLLESIVSNGEMNVGSYSFF